MKTTARVTALQAVRPWAKLWLVFGALAVSAGIATWRPAAAQDSPAVEIASADELDELVGPIALYPDDLIAIVLPASTYPLQVVQAERFLDDRARDANLEPDEDWDDSVVALLNYPEVVALMNDDLDWTYDLGTAVLNQRADVLNAIQSFRDRAHTAGNLRSDERQLVTQDDGAIAIKPADPQVIYVPYYEPERVVVYQTIPVYHYYPRRYPVYYYPYPASYVFDTGFFWGVRSWFSIGWHTHHVHVFDYGYHSHPYYGWRYYDPFYVRNVYLDINVNRGYVWEPRHRYGGRPVVRGYEGRVYNGNTPRPSRSNTGTAYRATEGRPSGATRSRVGSGERNVGRQAPSGTAYRSRSVESTDRAQQAAAARRPTRGVVRGGASAAPAQTRDPATIAGSGSAQRAPAATRERTYRSGGGMSQALERSRQAAQPSTAQRSSPAAAPRAVERSTGMPREAARGMAARSAPQRAPAPQPRGGGMSAAQRSDSGGGSYRSGGSSQRAQHPAQRGGEGRSAAR
jgi:hypothetical protein